MKNTRKPLIIVSMALLLAVVLAMGGVTFAKYISTTGTQSNQATVAKWGFLLEANAEKLFGEKYDNPATQLSVLADDGKLVVSGRTDTNVVAPGTTGSMTFSVDGQAEVKSKITVDVTYEDIYLGTEDAQTYNPLKWTLTKNGTAVTGAENVTLAEVAAVIDAMDETVAANTDAAMDGEYVLTWSWAWSQNDANDTILGKVAAGTATDAANLDVAFSIAITVEQVQE